MVWPGAYLEGVVVENLPCEVDWYAAGIEGLGLRCDEDPVAVVVMTGVLAEVERDRVRSVHRVPAREPWYRYAGACTETVVEDAEGPESRDYYGHYHDGPAVCHEELCYGLGARPAFSRPL